MKRVLERFRRRLADERGYSLVELLTVTAILGIVLGGLTTLFVSGTRAEFELNRRFRAQQEARLALDRIRREVHCASAAAGTATTATLTLPAQCPTGAGAITWCTSGSGLRWALYRRVGATCGSAAPSIKVADFLTQAAVFGYPPQAATQLAKLHVELPVDVDTTSTLGTYRLADDIVLRNSTRT